MKLVKPKLQAEAVMDKTEIDSYIKSVYEGVTEKQSLKFLPSFVLFVCCVVEECYSKKSVHHSKIDKKDEVLRHIASFLGTTIPETDKSVLVAIIEDLHSSGRIKSVSRVQKMIFTIGSWFLKKA